MELEHNALQYSATFVFLSYPFLFALIQEETTILNLVL